MKAIIGILVLLAGALIPAGAQATAPGLQLNPLKYEDTLKDNRIHSGHIDVSNPTDRNVAIATDVQGFKQANLDGDLEFFLDDPIKQAIKLGLTSFELGPRESVRVSFSVDPTKLPRGGVYAVVFFRTVPPPQTSATSYVAESANVGTLLLLQNGNNSEHIGRISQFDVPTFQLGNGIMGQAQYQNTNRTREPIAFSPRLESRVTPWGQPVGLNGPYVLPGSTRQFNLVRSGSFLGYLPITLTDVASGQSMTRWVFACTGIYAFGLLFGFSFLIVWIISRLARRLPLIPRRRKSVSRPLDGLSRKAS